MRESGEPEHISWNLGTPDNATGTEVIVNPYATKRTARVKLPAPKTRKAKVRHNSDEAKSSRKMFQSSISINDGGREKLISTVDDQGQAMTPEAAIQRYKTTGAHLGEFDTPEEATAHAKKMMRSK